jgi:hypothetical protein
MIVGRRAGHASVGRSSRPWPVAPSLRRALRTAVLAGALVAGTVASAVGCTDDGASVRDIDRSNASSGDDPAG